MLKKRMNYWKKMNRICPSGGKNPFFVLWSVQKNLSAVPSSSVIRRVFSLISITSRASFSGVTVLHVSLLTGLRLQPRWGSFVKGNTMDAVEAASTVKKGFECAASWNSIQSPCSPPPPPNVCEAGSLCSSPRLGSAVSPYFKREQNPRPWMMLLAVLDWNYWKLFSRWLQITAKI